MNSRQVDQLIADIDMVFGTITTGTKDRPRKLRRICITLDRLTEWRSDRMPTHDQRGGSSSPTEIEDRKEDRTLHQAIQRDADRIDELLRTTAHSVAALRAIVARYTVPIDHSKLPAPDAGIPGCTSCARTDTKRRLGPHFAPVTDRYATDGLCRWCGDVRANYGVLPPLDAIDVYHRQGAQAAGRYLRTRLNQKATR